MSTRSKKPSLRRQLLIWLLAPLVLVALISAIVGYYFALRFSTLAYDRVLFETARDISNQIKVVDGTVRVDLPDVTLNMIESDLWDRIYYVVSAEPGGIFIAGNRGLPRPPGVPIAGVPVYYDAVYHGEPVRIAALYRAAPNATGMALVQAAETINKRRILANEILLGLLAPELVLITLVGVLVWYGVARGLRPLTILQHEIGSRSHRDLSPLPETNVPGEVRPLIQAINALMVQLNEILSAQQRFISDAAHQLRTPLAGLHTQIELGLRQNDPDEVRATLHRLDAATTRTTHLVNQLLLLARAEPGTYRAQTPQRIDINNLAREVATEWVPRAIEKNIDLGYDGPSRPAYINGDAVLLKEMLGNLLDNAIRYTPAKGEVTVCVETVAGEIVLSVQDNGPGIPEAERERVFERFHRVLGTQSEGCGLGLAIVREIAQGHNAQVWLKSGANKIGTLVTILFPTL